MHPRLTLSLLGALVGLCLTPIATIACPSPIALNNAAPRWSQTDRRSSVPTKLQQTHDLATWQGTYNFIESVEDDDAPPMYMNYDIRISLARCGWRSSLAVNGHLTSLDLQTTVRAIDENTIGLYYQQDIVPTLQPPRFKSGELLLRIQRKLPSPTVPEPSNDRLYFAQPPSYRVYFEALTPLLQKHQETGLEIK